MKLNIEEMHRESRSSPATPTAGKP